MDASERRRRAGEEAAEWWVLLDAEDVPVKTRTAFVDWLRESALHVEEMLRVAQVHGALEQFQRWTTLSSGGNSEGATDKVASLPLPPRPPSEAKRMSRSRRAWLGVSLAAAATALLTVWLSGLSGSYTVATGQGERREISLADGSVVQIDPETGLRIRFDS